MKKSWNILLSFGVALFCFMHSGAIANTAQASTPAKTYYLITHAADDVYWQALFHGAKDAAKAHGVKLKIVSPPQSGHIDHEVQLLASAISTYPQGIALTIPDEMAFSMQLKKAKQAGIPVVAVDTQPKNQKKNPYLAYLGADNYKMGQNAGKLAWQSGKVHGRVIIANPQPGHQGLEQRAKGVRAALKQHGLKAIEELDVGTDASQIQQRVKAYFVKHPDTSAIFTLTSQALDPIAQMIEHPETSHFKHEVALFSFDNTPSTANYIKRGTVYFTMDQQPYLMGYLAVTELVLYNRLHLMPANANTAAGDIDQKNIGVIYPLVAKGLR